MCSSSRLGRHYRIGSNYDRIPHWKIIASVGSCVMYIGRVSYLSMTTSTKERPMYISLLTPRQSGLRHAFWTHCE